MSIRAKAYFMGSRERQRVINKVSQSPAAVKRCTDLGNQVKDEALDNIQTGYTMTASKGSGLQSKFTEELDVMASTLDSFPAKTFLRKKIAGLAGTRIPVVIVSYGVDPDSMGPVYGSLWEYGSSGAGSISRPNLQPLRRAFHSVRGGT